MNCKRVQCKATYLLNKTPVEIKAFDGGLPPLKVEGVLGKNGLDDVTMDIIDIGVLVFLIERYLPGKQRMNKVNKIEVKLGLRKPSVWTEQAVQALEEVLQFMGGTHWSFTFFHDDKLNEVISIKKEDESIQRVVLFSGGLDSLCGAATIRNEKDVRLVSFYTRQKSLQRELAKALGMTQPVQWGWKKRPPSGRGKAFRYRSFLFLCLAAATAYSYDGANHIIQYENGILASGVAPSLSVQTTKHAHYRLHRLCEIIFSEVLGGDWLIENPFKNTTKKEAYEMMKDALENDETAEKLANKTETCWNLYAGFKRKEGGDEIKKKNGVPCGFCVPCIMRQTALWQEEAWTNLRCDDNIRNHPDYGRLFREYYGMVERIQSVKGDSLGEFYMAMDTFLQDAIQPQGDYTLEELKNLFVRFADEFTATYKLSEKE